MQNFERHANAIPDQSGELCIYLKKFISPLWPAHSCHGLFILKKNEKCIPLVDFVDKCKYFSLASSLLLIELIFEFNFLQDETKFGGRGHDLSELIHFCFKKGVPLETVKVLMSEVCTLERSTLHEAEQV